MIPACFWRNKKELVHDKTYSKTCVTSKDSDQPEHLGSLIRVFADCMCFLQPLGYPKRDKREPLLNWVDVQADLSLCWSHRFCRPRWLSWMRRPTGDQEVAGSTPAEVGNILSWRLIMKYFLRSFSPFR